MGAVTASGALFCAGLALFAVASQWERQRRRWLLFGIAVAGVCVAAFEVRWFWRIGYPTLSPHLAQQTFVQPWYVKAAGLTVLAGASLVFVLRFVSEAPTTAELQATRATFYLLPVGYHYSWVVLILTLSAMIIGGTPEWWFVEPSNLTIPYSTPLSPFLPWWESGAPLSVLPGLFGEVAYGLLTFWLDEPKMLLRLAAVLLVAVQLRRAWRGDLRPEGIPRVRLGKLVTVTPLVVLTLLLAIPAGTGLGLVLVTSGFRWPEL